MTRLKSGDITKPAGRANEFQSPQNSLRCSGQPAEKVDIHNRLPSTPQVLKSRCRGWNERNKGHCFKWKYGTEGFNHRDHKKCCVCGEVKK
jgi:hypothetical protein